MGCLRGIGLKIFLLGVVIWVCMLVVDLGVAAQNGETQAQTCDAGDGDACAAADANAATAASAGDVPTPLDTASETAGTAASVDDAPTASNNADNKPVPDAAAASGAADDKPVADVPTATVDACEFVIRGLLPGEEFFGLVGHTVNIRIIVEIAPSCLAPDTPQKNLIVFGNSLELHEIEHGELLTRFARGIVSFGIPDVTYEEGTTEWVIRVSLVDTQTREEFVHSEPVTVNVTRTEVEVVTLGKAPKVGFPTTRVELPPCSCPFNDPKVRAEVIADSEYAHKVPDDWTFDCTGYDDQIRKDLAPWNQFHSAPIETGEFEYTYANLKAGYRIVIQDGRVFARWHGPVVYYHEAFLDLISMVVHDSPEKLPDQQFLVQLDDWMVVNHYNFSPVFSMSKTDFHHDVLLPFLYTWDPVSHAYADPDKVAVTTDFNPDAPHDACPPFEQRIPKLYFRGRCIFCWMQDFRWRVNNMTLEYRELFDAGVGHLCCEDPADAGGDLRLPKLGSRPFNHNCHYKFLLLLDGWTVSGRAPWLYNMGSVIFKPESPLYEYFYKALKPWVHYIPVSEYLEDLPEKVLWALNHPQQVAAIQKATVAFAKQHLHVFGPLCYTHRLLKTWAQLQKPPDLGDIDQLYYHGWAEV